MADGNEEREEQKRRREQERQQNRENGQDLDEPDEWEPERVDS